jgi:hypothetical protein
MVSLVQIGNYEIRMLEASKADTADGPLFLIELFDHDAQSSVDSCVCDDIEEGVAVFEDFISRWKRSNQYNAWPRTTGNPPVNEPIFSSTVRCWGEKRTWRGIRPKYGFDPISEVHLAEIA